MSTFEILMPKMGESVEEATITKWFVKEGDTVVVDHNKEGLTFKVAEPAHAK